MEHEPTVFVLDDDPTVLKAIRWLLKPVGLSVETYLAVKDFLNVYDPARPGCIVLDVRMPELTGLELQQKLTKQAYCLPIIFVTGHGDVPMCARAFQQGAFAFLEKPVNGRELLDNIHRAIKEDAEKRSVWAHPTEVVARLKSLTPREQEVMQLLLAGKVTKNIASELGIGIQTATKHRSSVLDKLGVQTEVEMVNLLGPIRS